MIDFLDILHDRNDGCLVVIMSLQDVIQLFFLFFFQYISSLFPVSYTHLEEVLNRNHIPYEEVIRLEDAMDKLDILYMTRVQKERFFNEEDYVRMKDFYILDKKKMELAPKDMLVLHPLPRVNEISVEVDDDPRAVYFKQAQYGVYVRMALILTLLGIQV